MLWVKGELLSLAKTSCLMYVLRIMPIGMERSKCPVLRLGILEEYALMNPKKQLIHDLQTFLWRFEQGGYTRASMQEVLSSLERVLEDDGEALGEPISRHIEAMIRDCRAYALGGGDPKKVAFDLDKLRQDLE